MDSDDDKPAQVEVQRMIVSALRIFEETTLKHRLGVMVETKAVSLPETADQEAAKGEKAPVNQAMEKVIRQAATRGPANNVIHLKVNNLAESHDFPQHLTSNLIKNKSFTVPIIHLVEQDAQVYVTDKAKFYVQGVPQAKQEKQATPPSPLIGMCAESSHTLSEEDKKKPNKNRSPSPSKFSKLSKSTCPKCRSSKGHSDYYKVERRNKGPKDVKTLNLVSSHFTEDLNYKNYRLVKHSQNIMAVFWEKF